MPTPNYRQEQILARRAEQLENQVSGHIERHQRTPEATGGVEEPLPSPAQIQLDEFITANRSTHVKVGRVDIQLVTFYEQDLRDAIDAAIASAREEAAKDVTRFEVIDHTTNGIGRIIVKYGVQVELSYQDNGRTLKVFLTEPEQGGSRNE